MTLVLDWQKKLGYRNDPFYTTIPTPVNKFIVGMHDLQEKVNLWLIKDQRFGTISGPGGTGKTMFLTWMNDQLAPQKSHAQHYIDAATVKKEDIITTLLASRLTLFERVSKAPLKLPAPEQERALMQRLAQEQKNVLLIDNAGSLGKHELDFLATLIAKTPTHVMLADTQERLNKLDLTQFSDKLNIETPSYMNSQLTEMVEKRISSVGGHITHPFDDEELAKLIKKADRNPAKLLQLARERAIELSLKAKAPPRAPEAPRKGFLSIKVHKPGEEHQEYKPHYEHHTKEQIATDAAALTEILNAQPKNHAPVVKTATPPPDEDEPPVEGSVEHHPKAQKTQHDKMVEQLAREFAKPKKKAKKKR